MIFIYFFEIVYTSLQNLKIFLITLIHIIHINGKEY